MPCTTTAYLKTFLGVFALLCSMAAPAAGSSPPREGSLGLLVMAGGRFDDMRMCVATAAGVKGGPIADIMLTGQTSLNDRTDLAFSLPVMRPILFGAAFNMLQFEPEFEISFKIRTAGALQMAIAPSLGVSLHYGPDYTYGRNDPSVSFFAAGPIAGVHLLIGKRNEEGVMKNGFGIKPFYTALFAEDRTPGTVIGGVLEYRRRF